MVCYIRAMNDDQPNNKLFWGATLGPYALVSLWVMYLDGMLLHYLQATVFWAVVLGIPVCAYVYWVRRE